MIDSISTLVRDYLGPFVTHWLLPLLARGLSLVSRAYGFLRPYLVALVGVTKRIVVDGVVPYYQQTVHPQLWEYYTKRIGPSWEPLYRAYLEPSVGAATAYLHQLYQVARVHPYVDPWMHTTWEGLVGTWDAVATFDGHRTPEQFAVWLTDLVVGYGTFTQSVGEHPAVRGVLGSNAGSLTATAGWLGVLAGMLLLRRVLLGVGALVLFVLISPVVVVVFVVARVRKLIWGPGGKKKRGKGKSSTSGVSAAATSATSATTATTSTTRTTSSRRGAQQHASSGESDSGVSGDGKSLFNTLVTRGQTHNEHHPETHQLYGNDSSHLTATGAATGDLSSYPPTQSNPGFPAGTGVGTGVSAGYGLSASP